MKICSCCQESKTNESFGKNLQTPDGLMYYCKDCAAEKQRTFRKLNPGSAAASRKRYLDKVRSKNMRKREQEANC